MAVPAGSQFGIRFVEQSEFDKMVKERTLTPGFWYFINGDRIFHIAFTQDTYRTQGGVSVQELVAELLQHIAIDSDYLYQMITNEVLLDQDFIQSLAQYFTSDDSDHSVIWQIANYILHDELVMQNIAQELQAILKSIVSSVVSINASDGAVLAKNVDGVLTLPVAANDSFGIVKGQDNDAPGSWHKVNVAKDGTMSVNPKIGQGGGTGIGGVDTWDRMVAEPDESVIAKIENRDLIVQQAMPNQFGVVKPCRICTCYPQILSLKSMDGMLEAVVRHETNLFFPMVFAEKMPHRIQLFDKLTFFDENAKEETTICDCPCRDVTQEFAFTVIDPAKDFTQEFAFTVVDPAKNTECDCCCKNCRCTTCTYQDPNEFSQQFVFTVVGEDDIAQSFAFIVVDPVDYAQGFSFAVVDQDDFSQDFVFTVVSPEDASQDFAFTVVAPDDFTQGFAFAVASPDDFAQTFAFTVTNAGDFTQDFAFTVEPKYIWIEITDPDTGIEEDFVIETEDDDFEKDVIWGDETFRVIGKKNPSQDDPSIIIVNPNNPNQNYPLTFFVLPWGFYNFIQGLVLAPCILTQKPCIYRKLNLDANENLLPFNQWQCGFQCNWCLQKQRICPFGRNCIPPLQWCDDVFESGVSDENPYNGTCRRDGYSVPCAHAKWVTVAPITYKQIFDCIATCPRCPANHNQDCPYSLHFPACEMKCKRCPLTGSMCFKVANAETIQFPACKAQCFINP